jgi:O-antigen/teichoic acid export membrane protein
LSKKYNENKKIFYKLINQISLYYFLISVFLIIFTYAFNEKLIILINGTFEQNISLLLNILLFGIIIHPFGSLLSNMLVITKNNNQLIHVMNYTVLVNFLVVPLSIYIYSAEGLAWSSLVVVYIHIFLLYFKYKKIKL